ncbi:MAG: hypothetical protein MUF08_12210 [Burkholderiaceae bacterium]|jgi:hypothetical protein|nr:hypothetical protein [Burkholderiaceae bacterium]MCU0965785.1 hypothetical protein [Burkholderiaceae bacterium]
MNTANPTTAAQPLEQMLYASLLTWGTRLGLFVLVTSFAAYVLGLADAQVPVSRLPELWHHPVARYLELTQSPTGWGWLALVHKGDVAGLAGIAILAGCSLVCLLALVPLYLRRGDKAYAALCLAEVAVVVLAASGWISGGH